MRTALKGWSSPSSTCHRPLVMLTGLLSASSMLAGCGGSDGQRVFVPPPSSPPVQALYADVSASNLPTTELGGRCMDARHGDVDGDGDPDLVLAQEFALNLVLVNDGSGRFSVDTSAITTGSGDNEDIALADFDADGDLDIFAAHEDDAVHVLLINDGAGRFTDASSRIGISSIANAVETLDVDGDGRPDILLGNQGANRVLLQQANGDFAADPARSIGAGTTQDLLLIDVDGDGDLDVFAANEALNGLYINDGSGNFVDESAARLPGLLQESREADAGDLDGDGDLDIVVGNVQFLAATSLFNRVLLNDGNGLFVDATANSAAAVNNAFSSFTLKLVDLDGDGDLDVLNAANVLGSGGSVTPWINDGMANFAPAGDSELFATAPAGSLFDVEIFDADGDGNDDIYFCYRTGTDQLYLRQ